MFEISIITAVCFALYFKMLRYKFVSDDFAVFKQSKPISNMWVRWWKRLVGEVKYRDNSYVVLLDKGRLKIVKIMTEEWEHFIAILIHTIICILIYNAFGRNSISFAAALLYATNPANNQGTIWPGGRAYALSIIGLLTAISFPCIAGLGLLLCSWFTAGFLAPLALIGSDKWWYLLLFMPFVWYIWAQKFTAAVINKAGAESFTEDARFHLRKLILAIKTFGFYLILCIIPFRITFYHNFLQSCAGNEIMRKRAYSYDRYFWSGILAGLGWLAHVTVCGWTMLAWSFFAFMITALPFCNLRRANQEIAERFIALPNVFLMLTLAQLVNNNVYLLTSFVVFYATRTYYTSILYKDEYFITEAAIVEDPHAWWAWHCRAMKRWDTGSYQEALILWVMANLISPKEFKLLMNIATTLRLLKKDKEADVYLKKAEENIVEGQEIEARHFIEEHRKGKLPILL